MDSGSGLDAIIKTTAEATLKLANLPAPEGKRTTLFRANSMPRSTYASIAVSVVATRMALKEYNEAGESDLRQLAGILPITKGRDHYHHRPTVKKR